MDQRDQFEECNFIYQDPGGNENYPENTYLIQTIYPADPGKKLKVKFSEFNIESSSSCASDYLEILNGTLEDGETVGQYCGTNRPPVTTSKSTTGALTFIFNSNESNQRAGWKAELSCEAVSGTKHAEIKNLTIYPNPSDGKLSIATGRPDDYTVQLYSLNGTILGTQQIKGELFTIDMSDLQDGVYMVRISSQTPSSVRQIILQR